METASGATYFFEVTPNPATDAFHIHLHGHTGGAHLYVRDQLGRLLWNQPLNRFDSEFIIQLNDSRFVSGTYYVSVLTNGEMITRQLVVVKQWYNPLNKKRQAPGCLALIFKPQNINSKHSPEISIFTH